MENWTAGEWTIHTNQGRMLGSEEIDALSGRLGIKIPDITYGDSIVSFTNENSGFTYQITTDKALSLCGLELRAQKLVDGNVLHFDTISAIPGDAKVAMAAQWSLRTVPRDTAFSDPRSIQVLAEICDRGRDWTYTSPYKGTIKGIRDQELPENVRISISDEALPLERLGMDNPILWSKEVLFYEDELDDNGQSKFTVRIRAMNDCFYTLIRSYLRVDHVMVRIMDTRIFVGLEDRKIIREFQYRESTYDEIKANGFNLSPQWSIDPRQADLVYNKLNVKSVFGDVITY